MCAEKFLLVSMGGRAEGLACADPGARTLIGVSELSSLISLPPGRSPILSKVSCVHHMDIAMHEKAQFV